jgi:predicted secreted protein
MKRWLLVAVTAVLLGMVVAGCARSQPSIPLYSDPTQPITVKAGQMFVIYLPYDPTNVNYTWREEYDQSKLLLVESTCVVCQVGQLDFLRGQGYGLNGSNPPTSAQYSEFQALSAGQTQITMAYKNSPTGEAVQTQTFTVIIQ